MLSLEAVQILFFLRVGDENTFEFIRPGEILHF